jgi:hypothetical protein
MRYEARTGDLLRVALVVAVLSAIALVAWVVVSPIDLPFQRVNATIDASSRIDGHTIRVTGTTNLPEGSLLDWSLDQDRSFRAGDPPAGQVAVEGGAFAFDADLTTLASGHLGGERVLVDSPGDSKQLFVPVRFSVP